MIFCETILPGRDCRLENKPTRPYLKRKFVNIFENCMNQVQLIKRIYYRTTLILFVSPFESSNQQFCKESYNSSSYSFLQTLSRWAGVDLLDNVGFDEMTFFVRRH